MRSLLALAPVFAIATLAGCAFVEPPKAPYKTKVDGWVEKGQLAVAVADERPIAPPRQTPPEVDKALEIDEQYHIAEWFIPDEVAASLRKMVPAKTLPLGVEREPRGAHVRVSASGRSFELATDDTGHGRLPLAEIAIATLEQGEEKATVTLEVADGGKGEVVLSRNDLLAIADEAELPGYGLDRYPSESVFWAIVRARSRSKLLHEEASRRTRFDIDEASASRLVAERTR
ncbi:MAG: hypothetical protein ACAI25_13505 [Planctomycetota bacterium]